MRNLVMVMHVENFLTSIIIIKFPYNARFDWLKQRTLSENKKWGKTLDCVSCFPLHFFRALLLPACFTAKQSTVKASLFV